MARIEVESDRFARDSEVVTKALLVGGVQSTCASANIRRRVLCTEKRRYRRLTGSAVAPVFYKSEIEVHKRHGGQEKVGAMSKSAGKRFHGCDAPGWPRPLDKTVGASFATAEAGTPIASSGRGARNG